MKRKKSNNKRWLCTALTAVIVMSIFSVGIVPVSAAPAAPIVERSIDPDTVSPGGVVDVTIDFTTTDENLFLEFRDGIPTGWTVTDISANVEPWESGVDPETGEVYFVWVGLPIPSGNYTKAEYTLHVPGGEVPDEYTLAGTLRRSTDPEGVKIPITGEDTIEVKAPYDVNLTVDDDTKTVDADVNATYPITVKNTGANEDTYDLSVTANEADHAWLSEDSVTIPAGESEEVELNVASFLAGNYVTTVKASSVHASDDVTVTTTVRAFYGVDLEVTPEERTVEPDEDAVYTLTVTNSGNDADTIDLVITSNEADFGEFSEATFPLSAGASNTTDLTVRDSNVGIYDTTVRATSRTDKSKWVTKTVTTNVTEEEDTTPPAAVTNLAASDPTSSSIKLTWTAPGDDGNTGTATTYDVRYLAGTTPITDANWATATQCTGVPAPQVAGSSETFTVTGLAAETTYYFAIKTADEVPNESPISNSPSGTTLVSEDTTAPAAITDLATSNPTSGTIDLAWTAPGDDGNTGTATTYDIRYLAGTTPITEANWAAATQCTGVPAPQVAGSSETFTVTGLSPDTTYYFAIKTADEVPNESPVSNSPSGTTITAPYCFTIDFVTGYNMITMPLDDPSVIKASHLANKIGTSCTEVIRWDSATQTYVSYIPTVPLNNFDIVGGEGYFVNVNNPTPGIQFCGDGWTSPFDMSLVTGYNMMGMPVNDTSVTDALTLAAKIGANCTEVIRWDGTTQTYVSYIPGVPLNNFDIVGGEGYFVNIVNPTGVTFEGAPWQD